MLFKEAEMKTASVFDEDSSEETAFLGQTQLKGGSVPTKRQEDVEGSGDEWTASKRKVEKEDSSEDEAVAVRGRKRAAPQKKASKKAPKPKQIKTVVLIDSEEDFDVPLMERLKEDSSEDEAVAVRGRKRTAPQKKASKKAPKPKQTKAVVLKSESEEDSDAPLMERLKRKKKAVKYFDDDEEDDVILSGAELDNSSDWNEDQDDSEY